MPRITLGIVCGLVFGVIDIAIMLPMSFPDKKTAITAAFIARFGIGFVIGASRLPWPGWSVGLFLGLLLSIPDALITKLMRRSLAWEPWVELLSVSSLGDLDDSFFGANWAAVNRRSTHVVRSGRNKVLTWIDTLGLTLRG